MIPLGYYVVVATLLFAIGLFGALRRTNGILVLMGIELMLNAVNINLVAFGRYLGDASATGGSLNGQVFAIFVMTVAAAEAAVGLAIILQIVRRRGSIDVNRVNSLRG